MKKKGQVTVFIILGIIVVILAISISYLQSENFRERVQNIAFRSVVVPEQAQGVVNYVEGCVENIASDGLKLIGEQGGYVVFPDISPRTYLEVTENRKVPYWLYGEDNLENIPTIEEMENELGAYIESRFVSDCGFDSYRDIGYNIPEDTIDINVNILDKDVEVNLNTNLQVGIKEDNFDLSRYVKVSIPSRLNEFYEMANEIINRERLNSPLEDNTIELVSLWSKDDNSGIPQIAGIDFDCSKSRYNLVEVGETLIRNIEVMTPYLQVEGSNIQTYDEVYYNNHMVIDNTFSRSHNDVNVNFNYYAGWPFVMDVTPRRGPVLTSDVLKIPIPLRPDICFNRHNFRYDLIYPVLVSLESGMESFNFVIEVFVDNNYGRRNAFGTTDFRSGPGNLFCDEDQRLSEEVSVSAIDTSNGEFVDGLKVSYICGLNECIVGETTENEYGAIEYRGSFPLCVGGELRVDGDGYGVYRQSLDTLDTGVQSVIADIEPYRNLTLNVKVIDLDQNDNVVSELGRSLNINEEVFLQLIKINEIFGGVDDEIAVNYNSGEEVVLRLAPGRYNLNLDLVLNEQLTLAGQNVNGFESKSADTIVLGHIELDDVYISPEQLENDNIEFTAFAVNPRVVSDVLRAYEMGDLVNRNRGLLEPRFS